jgi:ABC-type multidrug transport system ATPase subunit
MNQLVATDLGKKFGKEWIFRHVNLVIETEQPTVILGSNGSGKSTLLQVLAGATLPNEGSTSLIVNQQSVATDDLFHHLSFSAPYLELMEEFTLEEMIDFHSGFKMWQNQLRNADILSLSGLEHARKKQLKNFSSGMRQRVKLTLAIASQTPLLFLDEPCANLDAVAKKWYGDLIRQFGNGRIIVVCSNSEKEEYFFCTRELNVHDLKRP